MGLLDWLPPGMAPPSPGSAPSLPGMPGLPGLGDAANMLNGLPSLPGLPNPGGGILGGINSGINAAGNAIGNAFSLPGGHTDGTYDPWAVALPGSQQSNIALGWQQAQNEPSNGNGMFDPNYNMTRPQKPFWSPPPIAEPAKKPIGPTPIAEPNHPAQIGAYSGGYGSGPLGHKFEFSSNNGQSWSTNPIWAPGGKMGANWVPQGGAGSGFTRKY